jgi:hypothetical protein
MILITVPHAAAGNGQDAGALRFLSELEAALTDVGEEYQIIEGDVSREILDLNRTDAANSDFALDVYDALKQASVHIDLHSYPEVDETTEFGYDLGVWSQSNFVVFMIPEVTEEELVRVLLNKFEDSGISTTVQPAGFENYLTNAASVLFDVPSILVEVNEGDAQNYSEMAEALVDGVVDFLVGPDTPDNAQSLDEEVEAPAL